MNEDLDKELKGPDIVLVGASVPEVSESQEPALINHEEENKPQEINHETLEKQDEKFELIVELATPTPTSTPVSIKLNAATEDLEYSSPLPPEKPGIKKKLTMQERLAKAVSDKSKKTKKTKKTKKVTELSEIEPAGSEEVNDVEKVKQKSEKEKLVELSKEKLVEMLLEGGKSVPENSLAAELQKKDEKIAALLEEGEVLSVKELKYSNNIKQLRATIVENKVHLEDVTERLTNAEKRFQDISSQYNALNKLNAANEKKLKTLDQLEINYSELDKHHNKIQAELKEFKFNNFEKKYKDECSKSAGFKKEWEKEKIQLSLNKTTLTKEISDLKFSIQELDGKNTATKEEHEAEISRLESKVEELRAQNEDTKAKDLNIDRDSELVQKSQKLRGEYEALVDKLQDIETIHDVKVEKLQENLDHLKLRESSQLKEIHSLQKELSSLKHKYSELLDSSSSSEVVISDLAKLLKAKDAKIEGLSSKYDQLLEKHNASITELDVKLKQLKMEKQEEEETSSNLREKHQDSFEEFRGLPQFRKSLEVHIPWGGTAGYSGSSETLQFSRSNSVANGLNRLGVPNQSFSSYGNSPNLNDSSEAPSLNFETSSRFESVSNQNSPYPNPLNGFGGNGGSGPSVQLVGKLSSKVARLETELTTVEEELKLSKSENSNTGNEILELMKQIDELKQFQVENHTLNAEIEKLKLREKFSLELLGEKSETVEELRNDVSDLKDLLRQQVEQMIEMQNRE